LSGSSWHTSMASKTSPGKHPISNMLQFARHPSSGAQSHSFVKHSWQTSPSQASSTTPDVQTSMAVYVSEGKQSTVSLQDNTHPSWLLHEHDWTPMQSSHVSPLHDGDSSFFLVMVLLFLFSDKLAHTWVEFLSLPCTQSWLLHTEEHPTDGVQLQFKSIQNWHASTPASQRSDASMSWAARAKMLRLASVTRIMRATITSDKCLIVMMVNYCIWRATRVQQYRTRIASVGACGVMRRMSMPACGWHPCNALKMKKWGRHWHALTFSVRPACVIQPRRQ
jgi:hypothetical protein